MGPYFGKILNGSQWRETTDILISLNCALNYTYVCQFNPYAALGTFLVFCSLISLTILAVLMQMV